MCCKNQKLYLQGILIIEEFIHLYNRSLITSRIRPNWMTKHDLITCWCLLLKDIPLRINGTLIPSLTRAKPTKSCGEIMWHSSLLQLVRHVMMSQRLLPLTRPPQTRAKCLLSDKPFGTTCLTTIRWSQTRRRPLWSMKERTLWRDCWGKVCSSPNWHTKMLVAPYVFLAVTIQAMGRWNMFSSGGCWGSLFGSVMMG